MPASLRPFLLAPAILLLAGPALGGGDGEEPAPPPAAEAPAAEPPVAEAQVPAEAPWLAVTTGDEVRVRAGATINFRVLERLPRGAWVVVTGTDGEFRRIRIPGGVPVFVHKDLVRLREDGAAEVARSDVLMRPTPGQEFFPLDGQKLQTGALLTVLAKEQGDDGAWLKVLPPPEVEYFVHGSLLEKVGDPEAKREDLARIELERRDGYTGGNEAVRAAEVVRKLEEAFAGIVDGAEAALAAAPEGAMPEGAPSHRDGLRQVMTESGDPNLRTRAAKVARDFADRERTLAIAAVRAEKSAVKEELEKRLAAVEEAHRKALAEVLQAGPAPRQPRFLAVGTVRRAGAGFELVKAGVVLHDVDSLRYDLAEMVGMRVGVHGRRIEVDPARRTTLLRVDAIEILD